jgi:hypothetical protein
MRKTCSLVGALLLVCITSLSAFADITDYMGANGKTSGCPKVVVIKPELNDKNVFYPVDAANLETASNMIGQAVANKYPGSTVIAAKDLNQYRPCNVPVVLTKLKGYTKESAILGQYEGKAAVSILHFPSTTADAPDKQVDISATGDRHWGDDVPFMNAIQAVINKIQKTSF